MKKLHEKFIKKSETKLAKQNPLLFIGQFSELLQSSLNEKCSPIINQLKENKILPNVGLEMIRKIVFEDMLEQAIEVKSQSESVSTSKYVAEILNKENSVEVEISNGKEIPLRKNCSTSNEAESWINRKLAMNSAEGWKGRITSSFVNKEGKPFVTFIERINAFASFSGRKKSPAMKRMSKRTAPLSNRMKVKG
jgi:hypothetical protein